MIQNRICLERVCSRISRALGYASSEGMVYALDEAQSDGLFIGQALDCLDLESDAGYRCYRYDTGLSSGGLDSGRAAIARVPGFANIRSKWPALF